MVGSPQAQQVPTQLVKSFKAGQIFAPAKWCLVDGFGGLHCDGIAFVLVKLLKAAAIR
jgi:hypothetical protein